MDTEKFLVGAFVAAAGTVCLIRSTGSTAGDLALYTAGSVLVALGAYKRNPWTAAAGAVCFMLTATDPIGCATGSGLLAVGQYSLFKSLDFSPA